MAVRHDQRRRQCASPIASRRPPTDKELVASGRRQVEDLVLPLREHRDNPGRRLPHTHQDAPFSGRHVTRQRPGATQRPSRPAPAPRASSARAARTRPRVGWASASARSPDTSSTVYGTATCRRATVAGRGSQGAFDVSSGPTRRNVARYVAADRPTGRPTATNRSTVSGSNTTSVSSGSPSPTAHAASRVSTRTTRRAEAPPSSRSRSTHSSTKGCTAAHLAGSRPCGL